MNKSIAPLFKKYLEDRCTDNEIRSLIEHFRITENEETLKTLILAEISQQAEIESPISDLDQRIEAIHERLTESIKSQPKLDTRRKLWKIKWLQTAAAIFIIAFGTGIYIYLNKENLNKNRQDNHQISSKYDAAPGGNRATLTLADGNTINLSDNQDGIIIGEEDIKYDDGTLVIQSDSQGSSSTRQTNKPVQNLTLTTPNGGQYQITLPDGTKAWLNATSTLTYPSHFTGKERRVELSGEAYFEVTKNTKQPFIVTSSNQEVKVLGTHFNINAYEDDKNTKTTLLEGSIQVSALSQTLSSKGTRDPYKLSTEPSSQTILSPGQQSTLTGNNIKVTTINPETAIGWKEGFFIFRNTPLKEVLSQLSRWYDIKIDTRNIPEEYFVGEISRQSKLSEIISILEKNSNVKFKIEERRLMIIK